MKTLIIYWTQEGNEFFLADGDRRYLQGAFINIEGCEKLAPEVYDETAEAPTYAKYGDKYDTKDYGWVKIELPDLGNSALLGTEIQFVVECGFYL